MRLGQFVMLLNTTKDTVRHYEELGLLAPGLQGRHKVYGDKELADFRAVGELKETGLTLKDIKLLMELKRLSTCGETDLLVAKVEELELHGRRLQEQEELLAERRRQLGRHLEEIRATL